MLDFSLTQEQGALQKEIIRFAKEELSPGSIDRDRDQVFPVGLWKKCGTVGIQGLPAPAEFGGGGADCVTTALACQSLGYGCTDGGLVFSLCAHLLTCVVPIVRYGTKDQKERFLRGLCDGTLVGGNAMTEPGSGSDAFSMKTRATPDDNGFRLNGSKTFCTNGPVADLVLVYAVTDPGEGSHSGITAFLVETNSPGLSTGRPIEKSGLRTSPMSELSFDDVFLPMDTVVGGVGGGATVFSHSMNWERTCLFAAHVGTMERLIEHAVSYANSREQFGRKIGQFQAISHRIAANKVSLEAARYLVYHAAWCIDSRKNQAMSASVAKTFVSESLVRISAETVQLLGGYGFTTEYEVERIYRDSIASTIYSGTNEMQRQLIARLLGL